MYNRYLRLFKFHYPAKKLAPLLALVVALSPFAIDTYLPAIPSMARYFVIDIHLIEVSIPIYLFGFALGQIIGGPVSDNYGRKWVGSTGLFIFFICSLLITQVKYVEQLWILRFIQAIGGGFGLVICAAIVRDLYDGKEAAKVFTLIGFIMMIAPLIAPTIGAIMLDYFNWQAIFVLLACYALILIFIIILWLPETKQLRSVSGYQHHSFSQVLKRYLLILKNRSALPFLLCSSFVAASLFAFLTEISFVYINFFKVAESKFAWMFGLNIGSMMVFNRLNHYLLDYWQPVKILKMGLLVQLVAAFVLVLLSIFHLYSLTLIVILLMLVIGAFGIIGPNNTSCYMHYFPQNSGTANAVIGSSQFLFGGLIGLVLSRLHNGTPFPMFMTIFIASLFGYLSYRLKRHT